MKKERIYYSLQIFFVVILLVALLNPYLNGLYPNLFRLNPNQNFDIIMIIMNGFFGVVLMRLWFFFYSSIEDIEYLELFSKDFGFLVLALAQLSWALSTVFQIYTGNENMRIFFSASFSSINSLFLLASIAFFHIEEKDFELLKLNSVWGSLEKIILFILEWLKKNKSLYFKLISATTLLSIFLEFLCFKITKEDKSFYVSPYTADLVLSVITVIFLLISLSIIFKLREIKFFQDLIFISWILTLISQFIPYYQEQGSIVINGIDYSYIVKLSSLPIKFAYRLSLSLVFLQLGFSTAYQLHRMKREKLKQEVLDKEKLVIEHKRLRGDMNHAIRGTLRTMSFDLNNFLNETEIKSNPLLSDLLKSMNIRIYNFQNIHNILHNDPESIKVVVNLKKELNNLIMYIRDMHSYSDERFEYAIEIDEDFSVSGKNARYIGSIICELAINSYKYSNSPKYFNFKVSIEEDEMLTFVIHNNSIMNNENLNKFNILKKNYHLISPYMNENGYGATLIANHIKSMKGEMTTTTFIDKGTFFNIKIPISSLKIYY